MLKILKRFTLKDWLFAFFIMILIIIQVYFDLKLLDYSANLATIASSGDLSLESVLTNGGFMMLCALVSLVCAILTGFCSSKISANIARTLRKDVFNKVQSFSLNEINYFSHASLITRTTNDIVQIQMMFAMGLAVLVKAPVLAIWSIARMSSGAWQWTLSSSIIIAIVIITIIIIIGVCIPKFKKVQTLTDKLNDITKENLSGIRVIRAYNANDYQEQKFDKANKNMADNYLAINRRLAFLQPTMTLAMSSITLVIYWIGAYLMKTTPSNEQAILIGSMHAFTQYVIQVVMAFMMIIIISSMIPRTLVCIRRVNEVFDTKVIIKDGEFSQDTEIKGKVEFRNVSFSYEKGEEEVIQNISFIANKGETVAIIGATGSGKTTLVNLIPRFYDVTSGEVLVDDINVKDYKQETLHQKIGYVSQTAVLFKGDIESNLNLGDNNATKEDIDLALEISQSLDFVNKLDKKEKAFVAQLGSNFSGGQKQRLNIARALARKPEIVIFDDSFSALDFKTDKNLRLSLKDKLKDTTTIIVAQRIGTIINADKIIVLEDGKIAGIGTHHQLLNNCDAYYQIALSQLSKEEIENEKE